MIETGILYPKLRHQFRVRFRADVELLHDAGLKQEDLQAISLQIISFWPPSIDLHNAIKTTMKDTFSFIFEDDVLNKAIKAVLKAPKELDIMIDTLDGLGEPLETITYTGCNFLQVKQLDGFDYAGGGPHGVTKIRINAPEIVGAAVEELKGGPELLALLKPFYDNISITMSDGSVPSSGTIRRQVIVEYESQKTTFPESNINVNGVWMKESGLLTYERACKLAGKLNPNKLYTITWSFVSRDGSREKGGSLLPHQIINLEEGMVINVAFTGNA